MANKKYSVFELMNMNRHDRRRMAKHVGVKIPSMTPEQISKMSMKEVFTTINKDFMNKEIAKSGDSILNVAQQQK